MAKLGEARLGSTQFATPATFEIDEKEARERAEANIKSPFPTDEGTTWDKLLETILTEFEVENEVIGDIIDDRFVDTATQYQLNLLGEFYGLERRGGESDDHFRARIKLQLPRHTTTTTLNQIIDVSASLLQTNRSRLTVEENFDIEPARFDIYVEEIVFHDAGVTIEEFEELIQDVKAGGVKAMATVGEQFTHRSIGDYEDGINDPNKGYGGYDPNTIDWPEYDAGDFDGYGDVEYGGNEVEGYGSPAVGDPGQLTESSTLLDTGGPYADEITSQFT